MQKHLKIVEIVFVSLLRTFMAGTTAQVRILPESMHKTVGSKQQQHQQNT